MSTFNLYRRIILKHKYVHLLQTALFLGVIFLLTWFGVDEFSEHQPLSVQMAIIDRDKSAVSQGLSDFLATHHQLVELPDDPHDWHHAVAVTAVRYVLVIPEGFGENLATPLQHLKNPNVISPYFINSKIEDFITVLNASLASGSDTETALAYTAERLSHRVDVNFIPKRDEQLLTYGYFRFLPIFMVVTTILTLGSVLQILNQKELDNRIKCSAVPWRQQQLAQIFSCLTLGIGIWLLYIALPFLLAFSQMATATGALRILNAFPLMLLAIAIAFVFGLFIRTKEGLYSNLFTWTFLLMLPSGILVESWNMPDNLLFIGRLLPFYWYARNNDMLLMEQSPNFGLFWEGILIQTAFAVAILAVALVISKEQARK